MTGKVLELIKQGNISIPKILLTNYKKLNITDKELILLIYLIANNDFNPEKISKDLDIKIVDTLSMIDSLTKKDILKISTKASKVREEYICLDELYNKLTMLIINTKEEPKQITIYDKFEKEFARTLSPIEFEIIGAWLDNGFTEEIVSLALKEATYNGVTNLRYIDKILSEWQKKGIKNKDDIKKQRENHNKKKTGEIFEYDWLNEQD